MIDYKLLRQWAEKIYSDFCEYGLHNEQKSDDFYLCSIITDVVKLVEKYQKGFFEIPVHRYSEEQMNDDYGFICFYDAEVKNTIYGKFADIIIKLLDFAYLKYGNKIEIWETCHHSILHVDKNDNIYENGIYLCKQVNSDIIDIYDSIRFIESWAESLNIDLKQQVEWKIRYNNLDLVQNIKWKKLCERYEFY